MGSNHLKGVGRIIPVERNEKQSYVPLWSSRRPVLPFCVLIFLFSTYYHFKTFHIPKNDSKVFWTPGRIYAPEIQGYLRFLNDYRPDQVTYVKTNWISIELVDDALWQKGCSNGCRAYGIADIDQGVIWLHASWLSTPAIGAVVLSQEITHIQYGDPNVPGLRRSFLSNVFWRTEEEDIHSRTEPLISNLVKEHPEFSTLNEQSLRSIGFWPMEIVLLACVGIVVTATAKISN